MTDPGARDTSTHRADLEKWAPDGDPVLELVRPEPRCIPVPVGSTVLGRAPGVRGVALDFSGISREHCQITRSIGRTTSIMDLGSKNGTFVNGVAVEVRTLREGDRITLGPHVELRFLIAVLGEHDGVRLTRREKEVASLVSQGLTNNAIAERLGVTRHAIDSVLRSAFRRVGVGSRAGLAAWYSKLT